MPAKIAWEGDNPVFVLSGAPTYDELRAVADAYYRDPRSDNTTWKITDLRDVERLAVTAEELTLLAAFHVGQSRQTPNVKQAFVAPEGRFGDQEAVFFGAMDETSWETRRFATMEEARAWTGAPPAPQ